MTTTDEGATMNDSSSKDAVGFLFVAIGLFFCGLYAGHLSGESDRAKIHQFQSENTELKSQVAELKGELVGYREGRR